MINQLARQLVRSLRARIEPLGVAPGQFPQLLALFEKGALTQSELCDLISVDQSTMAHTLKRMERDGLVQREPDSSDRRRARIRPTPRALALKDKLLKASADVNALALAAFGDAEASQLFRMLSTVGTSLDGDQLVSDREDRQ